MKLFQRLLVAPAALGLLAPLTANAAELELNNVDNYSSYEEVEGISTFSNIYPTDWAFKAISDVAESRGCAATLPSDVMTRYEAAAVLKECMQNASELTVVEQRLIQEFNQELIAGGEGIINSHSGGPGDSFSSTTTMSGTAAFLAGVANGPSNVPHQAMAEYHYEVALATSFTGEDKLDVTLEAGNAAGATGSVGTVTDFGAANGDVLKVSDLHYSFPVGEWTLSFGDSMDASKNFPNACAISNTVDALGTCGAGNTIGIEGDVSISAGRDFADGWSVGLGVSSMGATSTQGAFTKESNDYYAVAVGYTADTYGLTFGFSDVDTASYYGVVGSITPEGWPTLSGGIEVGDPEAAGSEDTTQWSIGATQDLGEGTLALTYGTNGAISDNAEEVYAYDISYSYPINDSMSFTPFAYVTEATGTTEDTTGIGANVSFSF